MLDCRISMAGGCDKRISRCLRAGIRWLIRTTKEQGEDESAELSSGTDVNTARDMARG